MTTFGEYFLVLNENFNKLNSSSFKFILFFAISIMLSYTSFSFLYSLSFISLINSKYSLFSKNSLFLFFFYFYLASENNEVLFHDPFNSTVIVLLFINIIIKVIIKII
jgi:hypothetical protein